MMIDQLTDPALWVGIDGSVDSANLAALSLGAWAAPGGEAPAPLRERVSESCTLGRPLSFALPVGSATFAIRVNPVDPTRALVTAFDDSAAQAEGRRLEALARFPVENPNPVMRVERTLHVSFANAAAELILREWGDSVPSAFAEKIEAALSLRSAVEFDAAVGATLYAFVAQASPDASYAYLYGRDVTERRLAAESDAANRAKSSFLANMSHELRTPLNAILGYGELLAEELPEHGADALVPDVVKVTSAARHLLGLINDILDLSKIEAGRMDVLPETVHVGELVASVLDTARPLVAKGENRLLEPEPPSGSLRTDPVKLRQILLNLLSNAAKFTKRGDIALGVGRQPDAMWFEVRDTGVGLTPEQLGRLFQPFVQAEKTTSRDFGGTGLGLVITKRLTELLGGGVTVTSAPGVGTTFRVTVADLPA